MPFGAARVRDWLREALCHRHLPNRIFFSIVIAHIASFQRDSLWHGVPVNASNASAGEPCEPPPVPKHGDPLSVLYDAISRDWARQDFQKAFEEPQVPSPPPERPCHALLYLGFSLASFLVTWAPLAFNPWSRPCPSTFSVGTVFLVTWALCSAISIASSAVGSNTHVGATVAVHAGMFLMDSYIHVCTMYPFSGDKLRSYSLAMPLIAQCAMLGMVFELEDDASRSIPLHEHVIALGILELLRATILPVVCIGFTGDESNDHDKMD